MRPKKHKTTGEEDLFRARLDQIIDMKHELVQLRSLMDTGRRGVDHLRTWLSLIASARTPDRKARAKAA
jgi:hypothetical protein